MADNSFISEKKDINWFKNFWYYYKIHLIVAIATVIFIVLALKDCAMQIKPDLNISFISPSIISAETDALIEQTFESMVNDINGDEKTKVNLIHHTIKDSSQAQMAIATHQSIMLELSKGEYYLYLLNDYYFNLYKQSNILYDLSEFTNDYDETYSITVQDNNYFKKLTGIETEDNIHMCVRKVTDDIKEKDKEAAQLQMNNAIKILNTFLYNAKSKA